MSAGNILELAAALALIVGGIMLYRRRGREDPNYGSQTAVLLIVVGVIMAIHGLGGLEYRPAPSSDGFTSAVDG